MSKCVIMFKGGVETQEYFSIEMAQTFEARGYNVYWFDLVVSEYSTSLLQEFLEQSFKNKCFVNIIAFTFNFNGIAGEDGLYSNTFRKGNIWDEYQVAVYNMVVDHPLYYHKYLSLRPEKYVQLSIDKNHIRYMSRFFPEVNASSVFYKKNKNICQDDDNYFLPLGGTGINIHREVYSEGRYIPIHKRPIDVIFTGNYTPIERFDAYLAQMDYDSKMFFKELLKESIKNPDELIEHLVEQKLIRENVSFSEIELKNLMPNLMYVDLSVRFYYRAKTIMQLADSGIKVHIYGAGWKQLECMHPENIITAGNVDSQTCLDKISQSKISVNVMPWFKDGAHDRIFNSMLNGAVVLSDTSKYLKECFVDKSAVFFFELQQISNISDMVREALSDLDRLQEMADRAYDICIEKHTWQKRCDVLIDRIENGIF